MVEVWKDIKGYENYYKVSNLGSVKSLDRISANGKSLKGKIMTPSKTNRGYYHVTLTKNSISKSHAVHRIVAQTFILKNSSELEVNHKNFNKRDNRVENLEWCTKKENNKHANVKVKCNSVKGEDHYNSKLTKNQVMEIRKTYIYKKNGYTKLGGKYNVSRDTIKAIILNKTWKHI